MPDPVYANFIAIQQNDSVRLIFQDRRSGIAEGDFSIGRDVAEVVMSYSNARALRDLLNDHLKDEPPVAPQAHPN